MVVPKPEEFNLQLRPMKESDLAQVVEIETGTFPHPWPEVSFRECLKYGHCCLVLEREDLLQAFAIMSIQGGSAHILNLCVRPEYRQKNRGRAILAGLLEEARSAQVKAVFLEVRSSNQAAIKLYRRMNFFQVGIREGYYPGPHGREDALILFWTPPPP